MAEHNNKEVEDLKGMMKELHYRNQELISKNNSLQADYDRLQDEYDAIFMDNSKNLLAIQGKEKSLQMILSFKNQQEVLIEELKNQISLDSEIEKNLRAQVRQLSTIIKILIAAIATYILFYAIRF
jgi:predicted nuclease with TOPRIM domain